MSGVDSRNENDDNLSGLDMASTIEWYGQNANKLNAMLTKTRMVGEEMPRIQNAELLQMQKGLAEMLILNFPRPSQRRAIKGEISVAPSKWFHKKSTKDKPEMTEHMEEAICPTAIIPSEVRYNSVGGSFISLIKLFRIPDFIDPQVAQIIQAQGLTHEYAHTFVEAVLYGKSRGDIEFPDGRKFDKESFRQEFERLTEGMSPMSSYSGFYRDENGKYPEAKEDLESRSNRLNAIVEEMVECVTADMLGFVYTEEEDRRMDPFKGKEELKVFIENFLKAPIMDS